MKEKNETFSYTYSSINRQEVEKIRNKYIETKESDFENLKRIDSKITNIATYVSILIGIISSVLFAFGLILCINFSIYSLGLSFSFLSFIFMGLNPLINQIFLTSLRKKHSKEIIELSDKILNN